MPASRHKTDREGTITALSTARLGETVGAAVVGVDGDRLLADGGLPEWCLGALEANGVLVLEDVRVDDATQVAFSKRTTERQLVGRFG